MTEDTGVSLRARSLLLGWLVCLSLGACKTVGPDYVVPEVSVPDQWQEDLLDGVSEGEGSLHTWWTTIDDPMLTNLITRAAERNRDLRAAFTRIKASRARRGIATAERYPDLNASGAAQRSRTSESLVPSMPGGPSRTDTVGAVGVDGTWEVDVWGRVSRSIESADASLEATYEDYRDTLVLLFAEVALNYVEVRTLQARIISAENNIRNQDGTREFTQNRVDAGIAPELDVRQAERNLGVTESEVPLLRTALVQATNRLSVLLGENPGALQDELSDAKPIPHPTELAVPGVPADILRQRPDIRRAERELAAQTARIGVATAELYPRFSLNGSFGFESTSSLFKKENRAWSFTPFVSWNVFDGGSVRNAINVEDALAQEALEFYEQTVLLALEDVENSLVAYSEEQIRRDALLRSVLADQRSVELVKILYETGLTDFQNVLDTERSLFTQEDQLAESEGLVVQYLINIYRALGGGWEPDPSEVADEIRDAEENGEPIL
jgi:multidrug efflux system outer membrane protein